MSLKSLQESFIQQLSHTQPADNFLTHLDPCGNLRPAQQLAIYQNNVRGALQSSLAQVYPVCQKILGDNYFKQLARVYIKHHPSKHPDLNHYGESFSNFLSSQYQQRDELNDFPYLSDLARLEWLYQSVYYAAQGSVFDFSAFARLTEQQQAQSTFQIAPCLEFMTSGYPVVSIWQINQHDSTLSQSLELHSESYCIFRNNNQIELVVIDADAYNLLVLVSAGKSLTELTALDHGNKLAELINQGWIDGFRVSHV